ncbi:MAG TPA: prolyl oligopeptidase family serine peptidase [Hymenobacter sp.]|uniref:alpha/beta hydrolase family protein n=1 Tax=Hymenobacter sp. TaxID=1898978 RepID=UPI002D80255D|nr:prolyl oligopeptidase family serine peptidase [Hymenobacter sp.]HET9503414.1 prolyl oligopeptidase family serine peptidase [Hymenobacter sp.]
MLTTVEFVLKGTGHGRPFAADATYQSTAGAPVARPVVVFVHGFKGFKDWGHFPLLGRFFAEQGFVFVKLNLSHNGVVVGGTGDLEDLEAFGHNNFSHELNDLGQLLDALHAPGATPLPAAALDLSRIYLIGHSRGGGLVLAKAAEDPRIRAVATWAAVATLSPPWAPEVLDQWQRVGVIHIPNARTGQQLPLYYQIAEDYRAHQPRFDLVALVPQLRQPLLIVHGDPDETVPLRAAEELLARKPDAELLIVPEAGHQFGGRHPWPEAELPPLARLVAERTAVFFQQHA